MNIRSALLFLTMLGSVTVGCQRPSAGTGEPIATQDGERRERGIVDVFDDPWGIPPLFSVVDTLLPCGQVQMEIRAANSAGERAGHSRYHYIVINKAGGVGAITEFSLDDVSREPAEWSAPDPWQGKYVPNGDSGRFLWSLADSLGEFSIEPGDTLFEFTLESLDPPGALNYRAKVCPEGTEDTGEAIGMISGPDPQQEKR